MLFSIQHLAQLAKIQFSEAEQALFETDINRLLSLLDKLKENNCVKQPAQHALAPTMENLREDKVHVPENTAQLQTLSKQAHDDLFWGPAAIE